MLLVQVVDFRRLKEVQGEGRRREPKPVLVVGCRA